MRSLYLGLDNTQPNLCRAVCVATEPGWQWMPSPYSWSQSLSLQEFQAFWLSGELFRPDGLASTVLKHDPFGIMAWLEAQDLAFTRYDKYDLYHGLDEAGDPSELPPCYRRAYSLALQAAFTAEAPCVAIELSSSLNLLRERVARMESILDRLTHVIPF